MKSEQFFGLFEFFPNKAKVSFYSALQAPYLLWFNCDTRLDGGYREEKTIIPNVSPLSLKINSLSVINVGEVTRWAGAPGPGSRLSLSILSQQMLFLIRSESQDTLTSHFPSFPLSECNVCLLLRRPTNSKFFFSVLSLLQNSHQLKYVF